MKRTIIACMLTFAVSTSAIGQTTADRCSKGATIKPDGECWTTLSEVAKINIIRGFWVGGTASSVSAALVDQQPQFYVDRDWLDVPGSTTIGDISKYFDRLYETPANRGIKWHWAYILAAMYARDDDSDDRLSLIRFLRQNEEIPVSGVLVGAKTPEMILVRVGEKTFEVHLSGISADGLTPAQKQKAMSFINGLKVSSYFGCKDNAMATYVTLRYSHSLFQGENRLSAVAIIKAPIICTPSGDVSVSSVTGAGDTLFLNNMLVGSGLVKAGTYSDPKWPDKYTRLINHAWASGKAQEAGLYIHGGKTNANVERVAATK